MPAKLSAMSKIQKIHRIYTEDIRRRSVIRAVGKVFDNFTLQPTMGFYKGRRGALLSKLLVQKKVKLNRWQRGFVRLMDRDRSCDLLSGNGSPIKLKKSKCHSFWRTECIHAAAPSARSCFRA